jgi:hypothetical protein
MTIRGLGVDEAEALFLDLVLPAEPFGPLVVSCYFVRSHYHHRTVAWDGGRAVWPPGEDTDGPGR